MTTMRITFNRREAEIDALNATWIALIPAFRPTEQQFALWLEFHGPETVIHGIRETAKKYMRMNGEMTLDHGIRFASKCMNVRTSISEKAA